MPAKNKNGRWMPGNERYPKAELVAIARKYHEQPGWHKGARVYRSS